MNKVYSTPIWFLIFRMTALAAMACDDPLFLPCSSPVRSLLRIDSVREKGSRKAHGIEVLHVWSIKALAFSPVVFPVSRESGRKRN
jgi:hypothetical protein